MSIFISSGERAWWISSQCNRCSKSKLPSDCEIFNTIRDSSSNGYLSEAIAERIVKDGGLEDPILVGECPEIEVKL